MTHKNTQHQANKPPANVHLFAPCSYTLYQYSMMPIRPGVSRLVITFRKLNQLFDNCHKGCVTDIFILHAWNQYFTGIDTLMRKETMHIKDQLSRYLKTTADDVIPNYPKHHHIFRVNLATQATKTYFKLLNQLDYLLCLLGIAYRNGLISQRYLQNKEQHLMKVFFRLVGHIAQYRPQHKLQGNIDHQDKAFLTEALASKDMPVWETKTLQKLTALLRH